MYRIFPFGPILQVDDTSTRIRTPPLGQYFITSQRRNGLNAFHFFGNLLEFPGNLVGSFQGASRWGLNDGIDHALVFIGDKP